MEKLRKKRASVIESTARNQTVQTHNWWI